MEATPWLASPYGPFFQRLAVVATRLAVSGRREVLSDNTFSPKVAAQLTIPHDVHDIRSDDIATLISETVVEEPVRVSFTPSEESSVVIEENFDSLCSCRSHLAILPHLERVNKALRRPKRLSQAALGCLQGHNWPGNVRDLHNVIERSARLTPKEIIGADDLIIFEPVSKDDPLSALPEPVEGFSLEGFLASARKQLILRALETSGGNQSEAARLLGVGPQAVWKFTKSAADSRRSTTRVEKD